MLAQVTPAMTNRWMLKLSTTKKWDRLSSSSGSCKEGGTDESEDLESSAVIRVDEGGVTIEGRSPRSWGVDVSDEAGRGGASCCTVAL